jgi:hypothetical protein
MNEEETKAFVHRAIREHELRVSLWSGLLGTALLAGTWHAILLCR